MELKGTLKAIGEVQVFASGFQKREVILLTEEQYPQPIQIDFLQDKAQIIDQYKEGDQVEIGINIRGREWTNPQGEVRYFNSIVGWRIEKTTEATTTISNVEPKSTIDPSTKPFAEEEDDDLPF